MASPVPKGITENYPENVEQDEQLVYRSDITQTVLFS